MPTFRKKPVEIEAIRYDGDNIAELWDAFGAGSIYGPVEDDPKAYIDTLEGRMAATPGDWIIKGIRGELYPCKQDIFEATYTQAQEVRQSPEEVRLLISNGAGISHGGTVTLEAGATVGDARWRVAELAEAAADFVREGGLDEALAAIEPE